MQCNELECLRCYFPFWLQGDESIAFFGWEWEWDWGLELDWDWDWDETGE